MVNQINYKIKILIFYVKNALIIKIKLNYIDITYQSSYNIVKLVNNIFNILLLRWKGWYL